MKNFYWIRFLIALIVLILSILAIYGVFYPVKVLDFQFLPLVQRVLIDFSVISISLLIALVVFTLIFGRFYCSTICPYGTLQELVGFLKKSNGKYLKPLVIKYFICAVSFGLLIGGSAYLTRYISPYSNFGSLITWSISGIILSVIVLGLVFWKNRIFCTSICPVGTILGLISKFSFFKILFPKDKCVGCGACEKVCPTNCINSSEKFVDNENCINCLKCITVCPKGGITYSKNKEKIVFNADRRKVIVGMSAVAVFAAMIKVGIEIKDKAFSKIKNLILPPGARSPKEFVNSCLNCNLCVDNCPMKIIRKADDKFGAVYLDYSEDYCEYECNKCSEVCPSGAIKKMNLKTKQKTRIGLAKIDYSLCINCTMCEQICPIGAIILHKDRTVTIDATKCTGCGLCKARCPVYALDVYSVNEQKEL